MANSLAWYITRGKPTLPISAFYAQTSINNSITSPSLAQQEAPSKSNPWFPILDMASAHPDRHLSKLQRTLALYAARWGAQEGFATNTELNGAELLDGTLFLRIASLTAERVRVLEKEPGIVWDQHGFYAAK
jgi:hypothetical protein